jgi:hypothetical protein
MEKNRYTEYSEIINMGEGDIEVTVQIPENPQFPVRIIEKTKGTTTIKTEDEFSAVSDIVHRAMVDAGYREENE